MRTIVKNIIYFFVTFISLLFVAFTVVVYYPGNSLEKSLIGISSNNDFTNHRQNDFLNWLNIKEKNSLLLIGASKTYRGLNPSLFNICGYSSFNAGGSSQQLDISYFVLKEVLRYKQVNTVILDINPKLWSLDTYQERVAKMVFNSPKPNTLLISWLVARSLNPKLYMQYLYFNLKRVILSKKDLSTIKILEGNQEYKSDGFVYSIKKNSPSFRKIESDEVFKISGKSEDYLKKIISTCIEKEIELYFFIAPSLKKDSVVVPDFLDSKKVLNYHDFYIPDSLFYDLDHLKGEGANLLTEDIIRVLSNKKLNLNGKRNF